MFFAGMQEISRFQGLEMWICDNAVTNSEENSFEAKESTQYLSWYRVLSLLRYALFLE